MRRWNAVAAIILVSILLGRAAQAEDATVPTLFPCLRGQWGYINSAGEFVIAPQFRQAHDFYDGLAWVEMSDGVALLRTDGALLDVGREPEWESNFRVPCSEGCVWVRFSPGGKIGCVDRNGVVLIEPKYDDAEPFGGGLAAVNRGAAPDDFGNLVGGKWGFVDREGNEVIACQYDFIGAISATGRFQDGVTWVYICRDLVLINSAGKVIQRAENLRDRRGLHMAMASVYSQGLSAAGIGEMGGFLDTTGNWAIPPTLKGVSSFHEDRAEVCNKKYMRGFIDLSGELVIKCKYDGVSRFSSGLAWVWLRDEWWYVDVDGQDAIRGVTDPDRPDELLPINQAQVFRGELARVHVGGDLVDHPATRFGAEYPKYITTTWRGGTWYYINRRGEAVAQWDDP